jgi:hypothetical protein
VINVRALVSKFFLPGFLVLIGGLVCSSAIMPAGIALGALVGTVGVLQFISIVFIKLNDQCLMYRRFSSWHRMEYCEISKCGYSLSPLFWGLQFVKPKRFHAPFGALYFVPPETSASIWQQSKSSAQTLAFITAKVEGTSAEVIRQGTAIPPPSPASPKRDALHCGISLVVSFIIIIAARLLGWPGPNFPPPLIGHENVLYRILVHLWSVIGRLLEWPFYPAAVVILIAAILALRFRAQAITLSAALGGVLGGLAARLLLRP